MARMQRSVDQKINRLRTYNVVAGILHLLQAVELENEGSQDDPVLIT